MKIIWTEFAIENLKDIFEYYSKKANKKTAHKIRKQILASTNQLRKNPESGQIEFNLERLNQDYRYIVSGNYKVIYKFSNDEITIVDVFDSRQSPEKMVDKKRETK